MQIFKRNLEKNLETWKKSSGRKPLILRGARQVGKTTLIKEFAKSYQFSILLNLEKPTDAAYFLNYNEVKSIVESLFLSRNISTTSIGETLIFIDEIQEIDGYLLKHNMLKFESQNEFAKEIIYLKNFDELCIVTNYVRNNIIETNNLYDINLKEKFKLNKTELGRINAGAINLKNRVGFILKDKIVEYEK